MWPTVLRGSTGGQWPGTVNLPFHGVCKYTTKERALALQPCATMPVMPQALCRAGGALAGGSKQNFILQVPPASPGLGAVKSLFKLRLSLSLLARIFMAHLNCILPTDPAVFV